jgi:hypothetical protein
MNPPVSVKVCGGKIEVECSIFEYKQMDVESAVGHDLELVRIIYLCTSK